MRWVCAVTESASLSLSLRSTTPIQEKPDAVGYGFMDGEERPGLAEPEKIVSDNQQAGRKVHLMARPDFRMSSAEHLQEDKIA
jgi:hypothetical protein